MRVRQIWLRAAKLSSRAAVVAGIAATLLLAVTLAIPLLLSRSTSGPVHSLAKGSSAPSSVPSSPVDGPAIDREAGEWNPAGAMESVVASHRAASESGSREVGRPTGAGASAASAIGVSSKPGTFEHYRQLLDNPRERRLFRVSDAGDGKALERVATVVSGATQFDFYKITIAQGIVIDPRHPEQATVYAALVSGKGLEALRERLAQAVPDRVEESAVDPAVVTQLADIGQVGAFRSYPFGDVQIPARVGLAFRVGGQGNPPPPDDQPTIEQYRSAPIGEQVANGLSSEDGTSRGAAGRREPEAGETTKAHAAPGAPPKSPHRDASGPSATSPAAGTRRREAPEDTFVVFVWVERPRRG